MRISDWSSDVCSSDLNACLGQGRKREMDRIFTAFAHRIASWSGQPAAFILAVLVILGWIVTGPIFHYSDTRSEEHTSELQSLMRISYAVFCLKKKNNTRKQHKSTQEHISPLHNTNNLHT